MRVFAIALNTFREAVRNRILYVLLFFALMILMGAWVASSLAIFGQDRIVRNFGVAAINIISVLIAVFVGVGQIYNDLDKKTIYTVISKPISRWHFVVGKYLGLYLTICVNILFMTFFFLCVLNFRTYTAEEKIVEALWRLPDGESLRDSVSAFAQIGYYVSSGVKAILHSLGTALSLGFYSTPVTAGIMTASFLTMLEMSIVTAFAILFSAFSSPVLSAFMTVIAFLIGRLNEDLYYFAELMAFRAGGAENLAGGQVVTYHFSRIASHLAPNLEFFNQRDRIADMLPPVVDAYTLLYGVAYAGCVLVLAAMIFNRRNFK